MWTIQGESGKALDATVRSTAAAGLVSPRLVFANLATDRLTWTVDLAGLAPDGELIPEAGQQVSLYRNGARFFTGHALAPKQRGHAVSVEVVGPWWWLERVFLESLQADATNATAQRPTFAFPKQSLTTSLAALVNAAIALGVPMQLGTLATTFTLQESRWSNMNFAQAISELVRITPDMVAYFDYSGAGAPAFNTARRLAGLAAGSAVTLALDAADLEPDFELNPVVETQVSQVRIPYATRAANGALQFAEQSAGTPGTGKVQILTVSGQELDTFLPKDLLDSVVVKSVPFGAGVDCAKDSAIKGMIEQYGWFRPGAWAQIANSLTYWTGTSWARTEATVQFAPLVAKPKSGAALPAGHGYIIVSTAPLPDWAVAYLGAVEVTVSGTWAVAEPTSTAGWSPLFGALRQGAMTGGPTWMHQTAPENWFWLGKGFSYDAYMVGFNSQVDTTVYRPSDYDFVSPPAGLAAGLLAAQDWLAHEGTLSRVDQECGATRYISRAINVTGALPSAATMRAMVASEELNLDLGETTIRLGAPMRFSYSELVNKIRGNPNSNIIYL